MHQVTILGEVDRQAGNGSTDEETARTPEDSRPGKDYELQYDQRAAEEDNLSRDQREFVARELALFDELRGVSHVAEHRIVMRDDKPLKQVYYPRNPAMQHVIDTQVDELLRGDAIEPS